jgi:glucosamine--fructose-6-phosphate aminotransferase (isomerizing)
VRATVAILEGAYALGVIDSQDADHLIAARQGSPLVIGLGFGENFIASDVFALLPVTQRFIFLEEGDLAEISRDKVRVFDRDGQPVTRPVRESALSADAVKRGEYRHYMQKEIFEQPRALADMLEGRLSADHVLPEAFGQKAPGIFKTIRAVQIVACGTSYHAGLVARHWIESATPLSCQVEVASEYRYRRHAAPDQALFVAISQSGETADTLAALRLAKRLGYTATLTICNVPESSLVRESDLILLTHAGPEIGVASTKAFTTQLTALLLLTAALGRYAGLIDTTEAELTASLRSLPSRARDFLTLDARVALIAEQFADKHHALFLGRGDQYPIALEGALKLKEISYIHAEAYPAGELKHGPLALVDASMPVVAAPARRPPAGQGAVPTSKKSARGAASSMSSRRAAGHGVPTRGHHHPRAACGWLNRTHPFHHSPPAPGLSRRRPQGHGRGSATQPGQIRDGRVAHSAPFRPHRP